MEKPVAAEDNWSYLKLADSKTRRLQLNDAINQKIFSTNLKFELHNRKTFENTTYGEKFKL